MTFSGDFSNRLRCFRAISLVLSCSSLPLLSHHRSICSCVVLQCREKQKTLPSSSSSSVALRRRDGWMRSVSSYAAVWISVICRTCLRPNIGLLPFIPLPICPPLSPPLSLSLSSSASEGIGLCQSCPAPE